MSTTLERVGGDHRSPALVQEGAAADYERAQARHRAALTAAVTAHVARSEFLPASLARLGSAIVQLTSTRTRLEQLVAAGR